MFLHALFFFLVLEFSYGCAGADFHFMVVREANCNQGHSTDSMHKTPRIILRCRLCLFSHTRLAKQGQ